MTIDPQTHVFDGLYEAFQFIQKRWDEHGGPGDMWGPSISTQDGLSQQADEQIDSLPFPHGAILITFADPCNSCSYTGKPMPTKLMVSINPFKKVDNSVSIHHNY